MDVQAVGFLAIALYIAAAFRASQPPTSGIIGTLDGKSQGMILGLAAIAAHAVVLYPATVVQGGFNFGIFNAASLVAVCVAMLVVLIAWKRPVESLVVAVLPVAAATLALSMAFPTVRILPIGTPFGLELHVVLAIFAYSVFAIAATQALYLAFAEHRLRHHSPIMNFLPPLPTMETTLFQLTGLAFVLLSISLGLGAIYTNDIDGQHLAHKIVFSILAWLVFATLLFGRIKLHWRGRHAVKFVLGGFVLLALAFFGTKIVLELVLNRA